MKLLALIVATAPLARLSVAQYFSEGWQPGQEVTTASAAHTPSPSDVASPTTRAVAADASVELFSALNELKKLRADLGQKFDPANLLQAKPIAQLFEKAGVNITEKVEQAKIKSKFWDDRVPLITDENWGEMVVNEALTDDEEKERVWFVVISTAALRREGIAKKVDEQFDLAYNLTLDADDLPGVRFARIDYNNVTTLTTKWAVWRAPQFVVIKDRGQTLYFFKAQSTSPRAQQLRQFLKEKGYAEHQPWNTSYAPGGEREWIMDLLAKIFKQAFDVTTVIPSWVLAIGSGTIASFLIRFFHRSDAVPTAPTPATPTSGQIQDQKSKETTSTKSAPPSTKPKAGGSKKKGGRR